MRTVPAKARPIKIPELTMRFIQYILSHPQLIIAFLVIVGPVLSAIFRKLKEQSQARSIEIARERARIEALRTGGRSEDQVLTANDGGGRTAVPSAPSLPPLPTPAPAPVATAPNRAATARATLEELAARRRAELLGQSVPTQTTQRPKNVRETGRQPALPANTGPAARADVERVNRELRQGEQRQRDQKQQQREQGRRDQQRAASKQADVERAQGVRTGSMRQEQATREPIRQQPQRRSEPAPNERDEGPATLMDRGQFKRDEAAAAANVAADAESRKRSRATWRRAMIMQELLAQPVSIRRPQE